MGIERGDGLYEAVASTGSVTANLVQSVEPWSWHRRLGHCSHDVLKTMLVPVIGPAIAVNSAGFKRCGTFIPQKQTLVPRKLKKCRMNGVIGPF